MRISGHCNIAMQSYTGTAGGGEKQLTVLHLILHSNVHTDTVCVHIVRLFSIYKALVQITRESLTLLN